MCNSLKLSIEFCRMVDQKRSYLIIRELELNSTFVVTGDKACEIVEHFNDLMDKVCEEA